MSSTTVVTAPDEVSNPNAQAFVQIMPAQQAIIYRPAGVRGGNVYNTLPLLDQAVSEMRGPFDLVFDPTGAAGNTCHLSGALQLSPYARWLVQPGEDDTSHPYVTLDAGLTMASLPMSIDVNILSNLTSPAYNNVSTEWTVEIGKRASATIATAGINVPIVSTGDITISAGSRMALKGPGGSPKIFTSAGTIDVQFDELGRGAIVEDNTLDAPSVIYDLATPNPAIVQVQGNATLNLSSPSGSVLVFDPTSTKRGVYTSFTDLVAAAIQMAYCEVLLENNPTIPAGNYTMPDNWALRVGGAGATIADHAYFNNQPIYVKSDFATSSLADSTSSPVLQFNEASGGNTFTATQDAFTIENVRFNTGSNGRVLNDVGASTSIVTINTIVTIGGQFLLGGTSYNTLEAYASSIIYPGALDSTSGATYDIRYDLTSFVYSQTPASTGTPAVITTQVVYKAVIQIGPTRTDTPGMAQATVFPAGSPTGDIVINLVSLDERFGFVHIVDFSNQDMSGVTSLTFTQNVTPATNVVSPTPNAAIAYRLLYRGDNTLPIEILDNVTAIVFDDSAGDAIRSNIVTSRVQPSAIDNTQTGITNLGSDSAGSAIGATGLYSTIVGGDQNEASGDYSIAGGLSSVAQGNGAVAFGDTCVANAEGAVAIGDGNTAPGVGSVAIGVNNTIALGDGCVAIGGLNEVDNITGGAGASVSIGTDNTAKGNGCVAIGVGCQSNNSRTSANLGVITAGFESTGEGLGSIALGHTCHALNQATLSTGTQAGTTADALDGLRVHANGIPATSGLELALNDVPMWGTTAGLATGESVNLATTLGAPFALVPHSVYSVTVRVTAADITGTFGSQTFIQTANLSQLAAGTAVLEGVSTQQKFGKASASSYTMGLTAVGSNLVITVTNGTTTGRLSCAATVSFERVAIN